MPKIIMVYIYADEGDYADDKTKCITMLYKGISSTQPEISYTLPENKIPQRYAATVRPKEPAAENTDEANAQYFSIWDGSNPEFVQAIKDRMNDPDSFKHVETTFVDAGADMLMAMKYRGKNAFNATITVTSTCIFNKKYRAVSNIR